MVITILELQRRYIVHFFYGIVRKCRTNFAWKGKMQREIAPIDRQCLLFASFKKKQNNNTQKESKELFRLANEK